MTRATQQLRVGVVGAGANTRKFHIPGLQKIDGVEVVSVANRSRESGERVAKEFKIPTVYDNWREVVEAPDTNAIMIGTWPYLHCPVTLAAIAAGKHVLTEARLAMTAAEAREMQPVVRPAAPRHPQQWTRATRRSHRPESSRARVNRPPRAALAGSSSQALAVLPW